MKKYLIIVILITILFMPSCLQSKSRAKEGHYYNKTFKTYLILRNDSLYVLPKKSIIGNAYYPLAVCKADTLEYISTSILGATWSGFYSNKVQFKNNKIIITSLSKPDKSKVGKENEWLYEITKGFFEQTDKNKKYEWIYESNNTDIGTDIGDATEINSFIDGWKKAIENNKAKGWWQND